MRTIAVGDVHGCSKALRAVLEEIAPQRTDTLVMLGDYLDRGPDSRGVVDLLLDLQTRCHLVPLSGNHEIMFLGVRQHGLPADLWLACGGRATLASYGGSIDKVPESHVQFLEGCRTHWESDQAIFVHASYAPDLPMDAQPEQTRYWQHLSGTAPPPHCSGKPVFVGHTPQATGEVLDAGHLLCIDTYCFGGRWLSAIDVQTREIWQADARGLLRRRPLISRSRWGGLWKRICAARRRRVCRADAGRRLGTGSLPSRLSSSNG